MVVDLISILNGYGNNVVESIRSNLASTGTNATGKTSRSLRFETKTEGSRVILKIIGKPFLSVVETGRKPTPQFTKPSTEFVANIKEWLEAKGKDGKAAYGIAKSIHAHGTKLYQKHGRRDIISNVINQSLIQGISKDVLAKFAHAFIADVKTIYGSNNN